MTTIVDQLKKEAEELSKQASYLDEVNTVALSEIAQSLGISKTADHELDDASSQGMMEAIKEELLNRANSQNFSNKLEQVHTPDELLQMLRNGQYQIKAAASEEDTEPSNSDEVKQAAIQELVQNGVDRDKAENLVTQQLESAGEQ